MFTGIIQALGSVHSITPQNGGVGGVRLIIDPKDWTPSPTPAQGDSICVNGCCLTYAPADSDNPKLLQFDVITESLQKTNLGLLKPNDPVNLEPALTPTTAMGGHFVQGHIDSQGQISLITNNKDEYRVAIKVTDDFLKFVVPKGSITINGVSLTIASVNTKTNTFDVALIPTTLQLTTFGTAKQGDTANLESDMIARTVVHYLSLVKD